MRCARCDRIAVPQVLAQLPDGRLAFGLCGGCVRDEQGVVLGVGRLGGRRCFRIGPRRLSGLLPRYVDGPTPLAQYLAIRPAVDPSRGGLPGLHPRPLRGLPRGGVLRAIRHGVAVAALLTIVLGIVRHDPRRDPAIVAVASFALAVSVFVGWVEHRLDGAPRRQPTEVL